MPTFGGHGICCRCCADCRAVFAARREHARYEAMSFHERKAYRIAKRTPTPPEVAPDAPQ